MLPRVPDIQYYWMKIYAELIRNYKNIEIKNSVDNIN